jgi:hypothetical protein
VRRHRQVVLNLAQREHPSRLPTCLEQPTTKKPTEEGGRRLLGCAELMLEAAPVRPCPVGCGSQRGPTRSERRAACASIKRRAGDDGKEATATATEAARGIGFYLTSDELDRLEMGPVLCSGHHLGIQKEEIFLCNMGGPIGPRANLGRACASS